MSYSVNAAALLRVPCQIRILLTTFFPFGAAKSKKLLATQDGSDEKKTPLKKCPNIKTIDCRGASAAVVKSFFLTERTSRPKVVVIVSISVKILFIQQTLCRY